MLVLLNFIKRFWLLLTLVQLVLITGLSLWPVEQLPAVPGTDKAHHFIAYTALVFPLALARPRYFIAIFLALVAWGGVIELIQPFVNRWGEWLDFAANSFGAGLGLLLSAVLRRLTRVK